MRHQEPDETTGRTQLAFADGIITIGRPSIHADSPKRGVSSMLYVYVEDVDDHYQRARATGAIDGASPETQPYGDRRYELTDPEGHRWTFAQHLWSPDPDEC